MIWRIWRIWRIWSPCSCWLLDCDLRSVWCKSGLRPRSYSSNHLLSSHDETCLNLKLHLWPLKQPPLHLRVPAGALTPGWHCDPALSCSHSQSHCGSPACPPPPAVPLPSSSPLVLAAVVCSGIHQQVFWVWRLSVSGSRRKENTSVSQVLLGIKLNLNVADKYLWAEGETNV